MTFWKFLLLSIFVVWVLCLVLYRTALPPMTVILFLAVIPVSIDTWLEQLNKGK